MKLGFILIIVAIMLIVTAGPVFAGNNDPTASQLCQDYTNLGFDSFSACVSFVSTGGDSAQLLVEHCKETDLYGKDNLGQCVLWLEVIP